MVCCPMPWNCQRRAKKREERRREWAEEIGGKVRKIEEMRRWFEDRKLCPFERK